MEASSAFWWRYLQTWSTVQNMQIITNNVVQIISVDAIWNSRTIPIQYLIWYDIGTLNEYDNKYYNLFCTGQRRV